MTKENKKMNKKQIAIIVVAITLIITVTTFTYALWSRTHIQTGVNTNTYACFEIAYEEVNNGVTMENGYPQTDEDGLKNNPYEVQIKNTCSTISTYNVILSKEDTSNLADNHLKVAVDNNYQLLSQAQTTENKTFSNFTSAQSYIIGSGVVGPNQTKVVKIRSWMEKDTPENEGEDKTFTYKITIENAAGDSNLLSGKILVSNKLRTEEPHFEDGYPNSDDTSLSGLYKTQDDDGDTYYFRGKVENNYVQLGTYKEDTYLYIVAEGRSFYSSEITYSTYEKAVNDCNNYYSMDYSYESADECIQDIKTKPMQTSGQPILWRIVRINGDGTIRLIADNPIKGVAFNETNNGYQYVGYTYENTTPCTKDKPCKSEYNGSDFTNSNGGTNSTIKTYLENWYKKTLNEFDAKIAYGSYCNDTSYGSGTEDTTPSSNNLYYGPNERIRTDHKPDMHCPNPTKQGGSENRLYGGIYQLKIGLLTADEENYAGLTNSGNATRDNYLLKYLKENNNHWSLWTMSSLYATSSSANEFYISDTGYTQGVDVNNDNIIARPVINIAKNVTVTGTGTIGDPFVIE